MSTLPRTVRPRLLCRSILSWMDELDIPIPADKRADVLLARAKIAMAVAAIR